MTLKLAGDRQIAEETLRKHVRSQGTQLDIDYAARISPSEECQKIARSCLHVINVVIS